MHTVHPQSISSLPPLSYLLLLLALVFTPLTLRAQPAADPPQVGLALSGGGVKGFAHIGVLKVLEEINMPIDYLAGTSMGSIVGALYATGYRADALEKMTLTTDWRYFFSDTPRRRYLSMEGKRWDARYIGSLPIRPGFQVELPTGLIAGQRVADLLSHLTWPVHHIEDFTQLPIPFVCVATDLATGDAVVLNRGYLPDALRASMAVPTVFRPVQIDSLLLADGGIVRNLPAEDVRQLGADVVIGVDVSSPLKTSSELTSITKILGQTVGFQVQFSTREQREASDYLIRPEMDGISLFDFDQIAAMIDRGEAAARAMLPELQALADSLNRLRLPPPTYKPPRADSVYINDLKIEGLHRIPRILRTRSPESQCADLDHTRCNARRNRPGLQHGFF